MPKKHSKGGQSALRFARLRLEKRHNYLRKVAEHATKSFISGETANVSGLIVAGAAEFKTDLTSRCLLDPRLQALLIATLDISYGGDCGFNQAINLSANILEGLEFVREKQVICNFLGEVARGRGMYCFGMRDSITALEMGAIETLIVWDCIPAQRLVVRNETKETKDVVFVSSDHCRAAHDELQVEERLRFVDWIIDNHGTFGAKLEFVTDQSQEGMQFCSGFGGIGGVLRYGLEFEFHDDPETGTTDSDSDFA